MPSRPQDGHVASPPICMLSSIFQLPRFSFGMQDGADWGHTLKEGRGRWGRHAVEWPAPQQVYVTSLILGLSSSCPMSKLLLLLLYRGQTEVHSRGEWHNCQAERCQDKELVAPSPPCLPPCTEAWRPCPSVSSQGRVPSSPGLHAEIPARPLPSPLCPFSLLY